MHGSSEQVHDTSAVSYQKLWRRTPNTWQEPTIAAFFGDSSVCRAVACAWYVEIGFKAFSRASGFDTKVQLLIAGTRNAYPAWKMNTSIAASTLLSCSAPPLGVFAVSKPTALSLHLFPSFLQTLEVLTLFDHCSERWISHCHFPFHVHPRCCLIQ